VTGEAAADTSPDASREVRRERHLPTHVFNIAVLVVGTGALAWMLHQLGWTNVRRVMAGVGWWFAAILALDIAALACEAAAIHQFMRPEQRMVAYWRVLAAQVSGRAINILTPGGALGEATKVTLLVAHAPRGRVVSSIVLLNLAALYLSVAILVIGVPITGLLVDLPEPLRLAVWIGLGVIVTLVVALAIVIQRGAIGTVLALARGMHLISPARRQAWTARLVEVDRHVRELQSNRSPGTRAGLALVCAARLCSWSATTLVLVAVGVEIGPTLLVGVFSVGVLIGWISAIVPLGMGVADGSNYALFAVLGAPAAAGVFVTLLGRARSLSLAVIGLVVMVVAHTSSRLEIARRNRLMARLAAEHGPESLARTG
jgi:uncharacterized membrane protein YbhN (UPF0104 family)